MHTNFVQRQIFRRVPFFCFETFKILPALFTKYKRSKEKTPIFSLKRLQTGKVHPIVSYT